jgi:catechol 2,3-dioxygenase-like lactoylglutathione lyase family enzyme
MNISRIAVVSIPVKDQQAAKAFYRDVLGFSVVRDNPMGPDQRWVQLAPEGAETSITLVTWFPNMQPGGVTGLVLETDDVAAAHAELGARGLALSPLESAPWGQYATFNDPDGNGWVLQQSAPGMTG